MEMVKAGIRISKYLSEIKISKNNSKKKNLLKEVFYMEKIVLVGAGDTVRL
jgi:hypothetical protein